MKKSQLLKDLQEYLRIGDRRPTLMEAGLVRSEQYMRQLEKEDKQQELIIANERIKKLEAEIKELKRDPHTALNPSEKKVEEVLHGAVTAEDFQIGTFIKILKGVQQGKDVGSEEQRIAAAKYWDKIEKSLEYLKERKKDLTETYLRTGTMKAKEAQKGTARSSKDKLAEYLSDEEDED